MPFLLTPLGTDHVILLTFLSGIVILALGLLRMGIVVEFISAPVIAGFTSAAAVTIASSQVKSIFGLDIIHKAPELKEAGIVQKWAEVFRNFDSWRYADTILGIVCIVALLIMRVRGRP